jgi:hypothetical protein
MKMRRRSPTLAHIQKLAATLTREVTEVLSAESRMHGAGVADAVAKELVSSLVAVYMLSTTSAGVDKLTCSGEERTDYAMRNFMYAKRAVEFAVASGVQAGMAQFSGRPVEYCCQIMIVPPAINEKPC